VIRSLAFTERAAVDIQDAFEWYDMQRAGLGEEFGAALALTFDLIQLIPEAGPLVHGDLRRLLLRRFPYAIYYRLTDDRIEVRACLHQRRHARVWRSRV
jgi:plasmid stabilization system protein ParE